MNQKRVLVIDDEPVVLDSVCKILAAENYEVSMTSSAKIGIHRAIAEPFHLVLTDIRMPDIDGMTVLREIKRAKPTLPVLMITGFATINSAIQAMKLGAANYIEKPFMPDELVRVVALAVESSSGMVKEEQTVIHAKAIMKVIKKGASNRKFAQTLFEQGADILGKYGLTRSEKLALVTGDIDWIEDQIGIIEPKHKQWLIQGKRNPEKREAI